MTWTYPEEFDCIVIGGGHAGCEAAHASAKIGKKTLLITMNLDTIGKMSCNPSIGGTAKGHLVREIDALGGIMGKAADRSCIHGRILNQSKGPAVWSPRAQCDKWRYSLEMKYLLEQTENLHLLQGTAEDLEIVKGRVEAVLTKEGITYRGKTIIISAGTFMKGLMHIGETQLTGGRAGDAPSIGLSAALKKAGIELGRLKTGTPPRVNGRTLDYSVMTVQPSDPEMKFSYDEPEPTLKHIDCYITHTTEETKKIIEDNLHRSPLYGGTIESVGPRYCPSIEDKVVRFNDKVSHQIFVEPEGLDTHEVYLNGISSSLPFDVQVQMVQSIPGLENAQIMRYAYAIEYDYALSGQVKESLETKAIEGLFFAGQVNGTTGYEEAGAQGLIAGINAARKVDNKPPFTLKRDEAYIGVMIDDLITKPLSEPYRVFTSRAEYRLLLRQDNADLRLRELAYEAGMINKEQLNAIQNKKKNLQELVEKFKVKSHTMDGKSIKLAKFLSRPESKYLELSKKYPEIFPEIDPSTAFQLEINLKYEGYIQRELARVSKMKELEHSQIPLDFDYMSLTHIRHEAKEKLSKLKPQTLGQASRIHGVTPADLQVLMINLSL